MRYIQKGTEPTNLSNYRNGKQGNFDNYTFKVELREFNLKAQKYLCAYCMCRIENDPLRTKLEHIKTRTNNKNLELVYSNIVAVCNGRNGKIMHCDSARKEKIELSFSPTNEGDMNTIKYEENKNEISVYSNNAVIETELVEHLNLNFPYLKENRYQALKTWKISILKKYSGKKADFTKELNSFLELKKLPPFFGVIEKYCLKEMSRR